MIKRLSLPVAAIAAIGLTVVPANANNGRSRDLRADLRATNEVPLVSSAATGSFRARIADDGASFEYWLGYEGFEGTVTQAHIHIAQKFASGGISVWLCQTATNPAPAAVAAQTPMCGAPGGEGFEATGTISAEDMIGPTGQAVPAFPASSFAELLRLIRTGNAYANVHSTSAPGGEVRGQIETRGNDDHDDDDHDD